MSKFRRLIDDVTDDNIIFQLEIDHLHDVCGEVSDDIEIILQRSKTSLRGQLGGKVKVG